MDDTEPEPFWLLFGTFALGIGAAFIATWGNEIVVALTSTKSSSFLDDFTFSPRISPISGFMAGPIEEGTKLFLLLEVIYENGHFNQFRDGIVYAVMLALGFSFLENTFYFLEVARNYSELFSLVNGVVRAIVSTLIHVSAAAVCGYYLSKAKFAVAKKGRIMVLGLLLASILHGSSNLLLIYISPNPLLGNFAVFFPAICVFFLTISVLLFVVFKIQKADESVTPNVNQPQI